MAVTHKLSLNREILSLSMPAVIAMITTPILGLTDTAFTGHMGGAVYLAAIAIGGNVFNLLYWLFGFLRMGTSGLTAQAYGADNTHDSTISLYRSTALAIAIGIAITALQNPIIHLFGYFLKPDHETWAQALIYLHILAWGAPAVLITTSLTGWFIGMHSSRSAMWMSISIDVLNLATSTLLVVGCGMKIEGVAIGTLVAQWGGVAIGIWLVTRFKPDRNITLREILNYRAIKRFFTVNLDIFLRTLCLITVTLWFTRVGAMQGTVILAVNALLMQFFVMFSYFIDGVAYAAEAMVGHAVGARDSRRIVSVVKAVMKWGICIAVFFSILYLVTGNYIVPLLNDNPEVIAGATHFLPWIAAVPVVSVAAFMLDGVCVGATATRKMLLSMAVATGLFFTVYLIFVPRLGNHGLWLAFLVYLLTRSIVLWALKPYRITFNQS